MNLSTASPPAIPSHSYALCRRLTRQSASSFSLSFWLLPSAKRRAMYALYAFLRRTDDLGDSGEPLAERRAALVRWRSSLERALEGQFDDPLLPALVDVVQRFQVPLEYLTDVIDGVEMDLDRSRYETFADLEPYCYRVASVVGLSCIHIWGFSSTAALEPARQCGLAFQLTNILRDLKEDADLDRVYLPQEDFERFEYSIADLKRGVRDDRFRALMQFEIQRAENFYRQATQLTGYLDPQGQRIFTAMLATYRGLLAEIKRRDGDVLSERIRLSWWRKLRITSSGLMPRVRTNPLAEAPAS